MVVALVVHCKAMAQSYFSNQKLLADCEKFQKNELEKAQLFQTDMKRKIEDRCPRGKSCWMYWILMCRCIPRCCSRELSQNDLHARDLSQLFCAPQGRFGKMTTEFKGAVSSIFSV